MIEGPVMMVTVSEVQTAIKEMKKGKAASPSGINGDMFKALGMGGLEWMTRLINKIIYEERVPTEWKVNEIMPIFKQKGDSMECGSYREVKLLEHALKLLERVLEKRLRELVQVDSMQCRFMKGNDVVLHHTLPIFMGLGWCPTVSWDFLLEQ